MTRLEMKELVDEVYLLLFTGKTVRITYDSLADWQRVTARLRMMCTRSELNGRFVLQTRKEADRLVAAYSLRGPLPPRIG